MKIYSTLNIGEFHTNHCEDFLVSEQTGSNEILVAVLDGCTMGEESVFASILYGKILRNIAKSKYYQEFSTQNPIELKVKLKEIVKELIEVTKQTKNNLGLETNELLSTVILGLINTDSSKAEFITIGDGLIYLDGKIIEYEQNDKPDYIGYHLSENFEEWYNQQKQFLSIDKFKNLSICTDGIYTFKNLSNKLDQKKEEEIIHFLLEDETQIETDNFLERKIRNLKEKQNHVVTDDLAIIRIKNENTQV